MGRIHANVDAWKLLVFVAKITLSSKLEGSSHVVARILQAQSAPVRRNRKLIIFFKKSSSIGIKYLEIINHEDRTFKNDANTNACYTYTLHIFNNNLPSYQCIDWQRFQLPLKHMIAVFKSHHFSW